MKRSNVEYFLKGRMTPLKKRILLALLASNSEFRHKIVTRCLLIHGMHHQRRRGDQRVIDSVLEENDENS